MRTSSLAYGTWIWLWLFFGVCRSSIFTPARPPAIPLAVKSPYLSVWLPAGANNGGNGGYLPGLWPAFWNGAVLPWTGLIRVDGNTFIWMGAPNVTGLLVNQTSFQYTSTKSIFTFDVAGLVNLTVTFLSPVTPNDQRRASLPFSYLEVDVQAADGNLHDVQVYSDITADWVSGDRTTTAQWDVGVVSPQPASSFVDSSNAKAVREERPSRILQQRAHYKHYGTQVSYSGWTTAVVQPTEIHHVDKINHRPYTTVGAAAPIATALSNQPNLHDLPATPAGLIYHRVYRELQLLFSEVANQAEWGYWYFSTENSGNTTYQSGSDSNVRGQFAAQGYLANTNDTNFRPINSDNPTFGLAVDLGSVGSNQVSTLFSVSLSQDDVIQFEAPWANVSLPGLWSSYFSDSLSALDFFYNDYPTVQQLSTALDTQIATDSIKAAGSQYAILTSLALRQVFGTLQFAGNLTNTYLFLKEISSDGNVQTVDVIFPAHPVFLYTNPYLLKLLLDPLYINQESGFWPFAFSIHDIGKHYPNATGHNNGTDEMQPLEECGDMILMTLAYAQRSNDTGYLSQHYDILRQWNEYLVEEALIPMNQISTDDFAGSLANQTNLALKGIIGIQAMARIANMTGNVADGINFTTIARKYIKQWQQFGISKTGRPHTTLAYGQNNTHGLLYNLYADAELQLGLVPQSVYKMQSNFYPTVMNKYGVPLDTRHNYTKVDWEIFCAAVASNKTKASFISSIARYINDTPMGLPFSDLFNSITGAGVQPVFDARPVIGGEFAILALST